MRDVDLHGVGNARGDEQLGEGSTVAPWKRWGSVLAKRLWLLSSTPNERSGSSYTETTSWSRKSHSIWRKGIVASELHDQKSIVILGRIVDRRGDEL